MGFQNNYRRVRVIVQVGSACLLLFFGCENSDEIPSAHLVQARPSEGQSLRLDNDLQLVFDQPVSNVWVSGTQAQPDNGNPPTAVWKVASRQLDIWKDVRDGFNPEREVPLFITYEDEMGSRQETRKVKLGAFEIYVSPTQIEGGTVLDGEEEVDPDLLNEGITIKFSKTIKKGTIEIKPFSGQPLGWLAEWGNQSVTITPPNGQRLLNGMTYVIEIKEIKDLGGNPVENIQITFTTKK